MTNRYQQAGVNWLAFLRRFGLHGVLCDEMGLGTLSNISNICFIWIKFTKGKTLQTLAMITADRFEHLNFHNRQGTFLFSLVHLPFLLLSLLIYTRCHVIIIDVERERCDTASVVCERANCAAFDRHLSSDIASNKWTLTIASIFWRLQNDSI